VHLGTMCYSDLDTLLSVKTIDKRVTSRVSAANGITILLEAD